MRYKTFKTLIQDELKMHPDGLTWTELKSNLTLPHNRPCQTWITQMEQEIGLTRSKGTQRAYIWRVSQNKEIE